MGMTYVLLWHIEHFYLVAEFYFIVLYGIHERVYGDLCMWALWKECAVYSNWCLCCYMIFVQVQTLFPIYCPYVY